MSPLPASKAELGGSAELTVPETWQEVLGAILNHSESRPRRGYSILAWQAPPEKAILLYLATSWAACEEGGVGLHASGKIMALFPSTRCKRLPCTIMIHFFLPFVAVRAESCAATTKRGAVNP